ncbi:MAG TPA: response regulator [Opitutaceae bacterium]|jgi:two-component system cell cycle response regulator|nr:response regulator [Opitutaceae bacterium]
MRNKILTVDDSKTVRIIVRKAFKGFDCEILEAANGVEGLALAAKDMPDLILLDVTMPVMDGVEMLTKLKADPQLKGIPVMMLTAEGGREHVLKIAKIGVRDYIVKPFKEDLLVDKAGRIIDLKPLSDGPGRIRSILDPVDILVVEDKPAIFEQIKDGLKHTPWTIHGADHQAQALDLCAKKLPDLILVSLSLPDDSAFALLRALRAAPRTKYVPVFAMVVKTELDIQAQAQQVGFTAIITKPIDTVELEAKAAKAMNLDTSSRYYRVDGDFVIMSLPENCSSSVLAEAAHYLKTKFSDGVDAGHNRAIIDIHAVRSLHMGVIKLLLQAMQTARELAMHFALVGNAQLMTECKGFEDTRTWQFHGTVDEAKAAMAKELVGA